jgi:hypothetical protein
MSDGFHPQFCIHIFVSRSHRCDDVPSVPAADIDESFQYICELIAQADVVLLNGQVAHEKLSLLGAEG